MRLPRMLLPALAALVLAGCAYGLRSDPVQVTVAGVEALPGEGLELRMLVKLRVRNPNNRPVEYDGVYVSLDVLGKPFASGVSSESGVVPRFGETVIGVPVSVSVLRMVRQVIGLLDGESVDRISYQMNGKLSGGPFHTVRFGSPGEFTLPTSTSANAPGAFARPETAGASNASPLSRQLPVVAQGLTSTPLTAESSVCMQRNINARHRDGCGVVY